MYNFNSPLHVVLPPQDPPDPCLSRDCDQICTSTDGIAECSCNTGFTLFDDDVSCRDINECATNNGGCYHTCHNTEGDFYCSCKYGYELDYDGHACIYQHHPATGGPSSYFPSYPSGPSTYPSYPSGPSTYSSQKPAYGSPYAPIKAPYSRAYQPGYHHLG